MEAGREGHEMQAQEVKLKIIMPVRQILHYYCYSNKDPQLLPGPLAYTTGYYKCVCESTKRVVHKEHF
jgi:hypothetical protein